MTAVVQAKCPGCKKLLLIPADWIYQPIRCKHCGLVMHAKQPPAAPPPVPAAQTPAAPKRPEPPPAAPVAKLAPPGAPAPAAIPVAPPVAAPVALTPLASPFDRLNGATPAAELVTRPPVVRGGGWVKGLVTGFAIGLAVLLLAGGVIAVTWPKLNQLLPSQKQVALNNERKDVTPTDNVDPLKVDPLDKTGEKVVPPRRDDAPTRPPEKNDAPKKPPEKVDPPKKPPEKDDAPKKPPERDDPPKDPPKKVDPPKDPPRPAVVVYPRRALLVGVHNYLYANPVSAGQPLAGAHNLDYLAAKLTTGLKVPANQIALLSDQAGNNKARAPVKQVIERTLVDFLGGSRDQDRVLVFFVGHAVEIEDEAYLVPIEGELGNPATLIPLKWVFEELRNCRARQKILVLDTGRFSPTQGLERPGSGPMGPKLDAALTAPPPGVQVWSAAVAGQMSYQTDNSLMGVFLDKLVVTLEKGVPNVTPRPEDPIPLAPLNDAVNAAMKAELTPLKLTQTARVTGKEPERGAAYDPAVSAPAQPTLATSATVQPNVKLLRSVLDEISTPPVKGSIHGDSTLKVEMLPPFPAKALQKYDLDGDDKLREPIQKARAALWAVSGANPPEPLKEEVQKIRGRIKINLSALKDGFRSPGNMGQFKQQMEIHGRQVADLIGELEDAYKVLKQAEAERDAAPKRWQANYDFMTARMEEQIGFLYEYQAMLGQVRKDALPPLEGGATGWKLAATEKPSGDTTAKKLAKSAAKTLDKMGEEHKGTPWEVLAKREKLTSLGLEWKAAVVK